MTRTAVVALGGNVLVAEGQRGTEPDAVIDKWLVVDTIASDDPTDQSLGTRITSVPSRRGALA